MTIGINNLSNSKNIQKHCNVIIKDNYCYFMINGLSHGELVNAIDFKSWISSGYKKACSIRYVSFIKSLGNKKYILRTSIGFGPLFIRHLKIIGFIVDGSIFRTKDIYLPKFKFTLYDFQQKMIDNWLDAGGVGVVKSPTGSGKTVIGCKMIDEVKKKTLILVHTSDLLTNVWISSLIDCFGPTIVNKVGIVGGKLSNSDRMSMRLGSKEGFASNMEKDIVIATFQTLVKHLDELPNYKFGLEIVDECIPIDSKIWAMDGIINLDDLDRNNNIYKVLSGDNNNNITENVYNKIKTVFKDMYKTIVETGDDITCSLDHYVHTKNGYVKMIDAKNISRSLLKPYDMSKECILARLFGYMLGDGWIDISGGCGAGGDTKGLQMMANDLKKLNYFIGFGTWKVGKERNLSSIIHEESGKILIVKGTVTVIKLSKSLSDMLVKLGFPIGKKTNQSYCIPDWIMNGDINIKREFVAGYLGAEGTNPIFRGNDDNKLKKSFFAPRFSINKRKDLVNEGLKFIEQFKKLFEDLDVNISNIKVIDGNIRVDGTVTKKILVTIGNSFDNLIKYLDIGYRYAPEKEKYGETIRLYLNYLKQVYDEKNIIRDMTLDLYNSGKKNRSLIISSINGQMMKSQSNICSAWDINYNNTEDIVKKCLITVTDGIISDILYPHKDKNNDDILTLNIANVIDFKKWSDKVNGDFIFLDILRHKYKNFEQGYDLQVHSDHNYIVNGFQIHNCHHAPADMFRKVSSVISSPYKCGLSATLKRLDGLEKDCFGQLGDIQSSVTIRELINKGILAEPRFQSPMIVDEQITEAVEKCGYRGLEFSRFVKKKSASSDKKLNFIINICRNIDARNRKFLLFTDYVAAEDVFIRDNYANSLLNVNVPVDVIDQGMSSEDRNTVFNNLETGVISGIVLGKLGSEGVNIPSVNAVIMANAVKSPITFTQRVGRAMRSAPGKVFCDAYEILMDIPIELKWSYFNFQEYRDEGFQKLVYKVE